MGNAASTPAMPAAAPASIKSEPSVPVPNINSASMISANAPTDANKPTGSACPVSKAPAEPGAKCPLGFGKKAAATPVEALSTEVPPVPVAASTAVPTAGGGCPVKHTAPAAASPAAGAGGGCPVKTTSGEKGASVKDFYVNKDQFNVYGQKIDPSNNMPAVANQAPAPNQAIPLSTERVPSNIPKGGTADGTWQYPSPQMFWNALVKKNKTEDASEDHMATVVAIHNNMNEKTWQQVLAWEELDKQPEGSGREPKLLRFTGRPDELSPKARFRMLLGQPAPFDRHDWMVDRGGRLVRYVIDYYHDEEGAAKDEVPKSMMDMESMKSIRLDVRPALDSPSALFDRLVMMPIKRLTGSTSFKPLPIWWRPRVPQIAAPSATMTSKQEELKIKWDGIKTKCEPIREKLSKCDEAKDPDACYMVNSIALQKCTASVVCPSVAKDLETALNATDTGKIDLAFEAVQACLDDFGKQSRENAK